MTHAAPRPQDQDADQPREGGDAKVEAAES